MTLKKNVLRSKLVNVVDVTDKTHRTRYLRSIFKPEKTMIKSAKYNTKLGKSSDRVQVRMWKGMPMYALTLEERNSCTPDCLQYTNCYGNNMPFAKRYDHTDKQFFKYLALNVEQLAKEKRNQQGFVVRLHVLGDFFSIPYVMQWRLELMKHPNLRLFGYTHHPHNSPIGQLIDQLNTLYPDRCRIRFSGDMGTSFRSRVIPGVRAKKARYFSSYDISLVQPGEVVCPEQLGKTSGCTDCGYCWASKNPVIFLDH